MSRSDEKENVLRKALLWLRTHMPRGIVLRRWRDTLLTATAAAAVAVTLASPVLAMFIKATRTISFSQLVAIDIFIACLVGGALIASCPLEIGARQALRNPPPFLISAIAFLFISATWWFWPVFRPEIVSTNVALGVGASGLIVAIVALTWSSVSLLRSARRRRFALPKDAETSSSRSVSDFGSISFEELKAWLATDDEIRDETEDMFGHWRIATRIARRLRVGVGKEASVALLGEIGAGKSSMLSLVLSRLKETGVLGEKLLIASTSLWPFESGDAAIRGILSAIRRELAGQTSTLAVSGVSQQYLQIVTKLDSRLSMFSEVLGSLPSSREVLEGYDKLAELIGVKVVVWIEDLERFEQGRDKDTAAIKALLYQLQQLEHMTVVMATSNAAAAALDPEKIARYIERLPTLDCEDVWLLFRSFRKGSKEAYPKDLPCALPSVLNPFESTAANPLLTEEAKRRTVPGAVAYFCSTPRVLKQALRQADDIWTRLHGEINLEQTILMSVLRVSRPAIFSVVEFWSESLRNDKRQFPSRTLFADQITFNSALELATTSPRELDQAHEIIDFVFPGRHDRRDNTIAPSPLQGFGASGPRDYWRRYFLQEVIPEEESDQAVLLAVKKCNDGSSDDLKKLFANESQSHSATFFASRVISGPRLLELFEEVVEDLLDAPSGKDLDTAVFWGAVNAMTNARSMGRLQSQHVAKVTKNLLTKSIDHGLRYVYPLQLAFSQLDGHSTLVEPNDEETLKLHVRGLLLDLSGKPKSFAVAMQGLDRSTFGFLLYGVHTSRPLDRLPFPKWPRLAATILDAIEHDAPAVVPSVLTLLVTYSSGEFGPSKPNAFALDTARMLFDPDQLHKALETATLHGEKFDSTEKEMLNIALEALRAERSRQLPPPQTPRPANPRRKKGSRRGE